MISVQEAQQAVVQHAFRGKVHRVALQHARGRILAKDIRSPLHLPPFHQSAMDGYAIRHNDWLKKKPITVVGESVAGKSFDKKIVSGQAVRIFTGAEVPRGADTVVIQEHVTAQNTVIAINDNNLTAGANIRSKASHIAKNTLAVAKGTLLTEAALGFIASMGITHVPVYAAPTVSIIVTGSELQQPGTVLTHGKIFESNSVALLVALQGCGIANAKVYRVHDTIRATQTAIHKAIENSDIVLCTGGISVGDYDFVGRALKQERVRDMFYKVKQKPGKPLFAGTKGRTLVFGLPGNPASVLTCFYEYVYPAVRTFMGFEHPFLPSIQVPVRASYSKKKGLTHFVKAVTDFKTVSILSGQESYIMKSYSQANCLAVIPEDTEQVATGDIITVHVLPVAFME